MDILGELYELGYEDVMYLPDFGEECIIGIDVNGRAVYSYEKMIKCLVNEGMDDIEAIEYIDYNVINTLPYIDNYTNGHAPIIMYSREWMGF